MPDLTTNADVTWSESSGDLTARANRLNDGTDTATASEVRAFIDKEGAANGLATLDADGTLTGTELPSYVRKWFDTQAKIQAEIDRLGSTGGTVEIAPTEVSIATEDEVTGDSLTTPYGLLVNASNGPLTLVGTQGVTTLKLAADQDADTVPLLIRAADGAKRTAATRVEGIILDGNIDNQANSWTDFGMLLIAYSDNVTVVDCEFKEQPYFGVQVFRKSENTRFLQSTFRRTPDNSLGLRLEAGLAIVDNCRFIGEGTTTAALATVSCNADIGVRGERVTFTRNVFRDANTFLSMDGAARCLVANNEFVDLLATAGDSIAIRHYDHTTTDYSSEYNRIVDNLFYNVRNGIKLDGQSTGEGASYNHIFGNRIIEGPDISLAFGIRESNNPATVDYNIAKENIVKGASTALQVNGANSDIASGSNYVYA